MGILSGKDSCNNWTGENLNSIEKIIEVLDVLSGKRWICRGQAKNYGKKLLAPIDRPMYSYLERKEKIS